jgi:hypothetical protein
VVEVLVENKSRIIPDQYIFDIISLITERYLAEGKIILVMSERNSRKLGECIPKSLLEYAKRESFFREYLNEKWDAGVIIYPKACKYYEDYPAFFTYLLGHEFGHAYACLKDENLHLFYCLIQDFIKEASKGKVTRWDQLPHEVLFDQYGLYIAELLYSREEINRQFEMIIKMGDCGDLERLNKLLSLPSSSDFSSLREDLIKFSLPFKENLIELWVKDLKEVTLAKEPAITQLVNDFELLFEHNK